MKTRLCLCLLVSLLSVMQGVAQTVFEAEMGNTPSNFDGWKRSNARQIETAEGLDFVLGVDGVNTGYAITPELLLTTIKTPNDPQVTFYMKVDDTSTALNVTVENSGTIDDNTTFTCNTTGWYKKTLHISGGNDRTRLKFESTAGAVYLLKLQVAQDNIFYESFNNITNPNGNNGFDGTTLYGVADRTKLDNTSCEMTAISADRCIFINNTEHYTTPTLNLTKNAVLSFKVAGDIDRDAQTDLYYLKSKTNSSKVDKSITPEKGQWSTYKTTIYSARPYASFYGKNYFLDDVKVYYPLTLTLRDNTDLTTPIARQKDEIVDVTVNRTFPAGQWCTLCLPFNLNQSAINKAAGENNKATIRTLKRVEGGTFYFDCVEEGTVVKAGTPFLIKLSQQLAYPTFSLVTITATEPTVSIDDKGYGFAGTFSPIALHTDGTHAFLAGADSEGKQYIYTPSAGKNTMNGLRAYFVLPSRSSNARIHIADEDELSAISEHRSTDRRPARAGISDLSGRRMSSGRASLSKGIYIVDGRKTIVK